MAECPGKKSWPELVGKNEENAAAKIEQENHGVRAIVLLAGPGYWKGLQPPGTEGAIGSGSGLMNAASSLGFLVLVRRAIRSLDLIQVRRELLVNRIYLGEMYTLDLITNR
ncbi:hypothetical protein ACFX1X_036162 [Malus domestica]